jgi:lipopolysaccharide export system permease protein
MTIITKHLIKAHLGPFLFAFSALTGLLFLNAIAQRIEDLVGKGLPWSIIGEFLILSLPHTIALTLPMSILVALLYTFSELTAANELTAMSAGGIRPIRILTPPLLLGIGMAVVMLFFNDQILPSANHQLKDLVVDISEKSPTFVLQERVINRVETQDQSRIIYLQASTIDRNTDTLEDVVIYDLSDPGIHRTTYASQGEMIFDEEQSDLYLTLYSGEVLQVDLGRPGEFNRSEFQKQILPLKGITNELERQGSGSTLSDREMSISMLKEAITEKSTEIATIRNETLERARFSVSEMTKDLSKTTTTAGPDGVLRISQSVRMDALNTHQNQLQIAALASTIDRYSVEVHKKYAIAFACIVFVLIGGPLGIRFPRGGIGMVILVSVFVFGIYWTGLIGGENLADRGIIAPVWAMWTPNIVFLCLGLLLTFGLGRMENSNRGGGLDETFSVLGDLINKCLRPLRATK